MFNSKLLLLLRSFSYKELKKLEKFVSSPYFNENEEVITLFHYIREQFDFSLVDPAEGKAELLTKEAAFNALFPGESYRDLRVRHLMSALNKLAKRFLAIRNFEDSPVLPHLHLLRELRTQTPGKVYELSMKEALQSLAQQPVHNDEFYYHRFLLESERNLYLQQQNVRSLDSNIQLAVDSLDLSYLITKPKSACAILNNQKVLDLENRILLLDEIRRHIDQTDYSAVPAILIYGLILRTLTEPEEESHFKGLIQALDENADQFSKAEAREMYTFAQNYCIRKINQGLVDYLESLFAIYENLLDREIILEAGLLSPWDYKNILVVALRLSRFEWAEHFVRKYKNYIPEDFRENAYTYNLAKLHFYKKEYSEVLKLLQQVEYEDVFYNLDSKVMLLKTYYDLEEIEALYSLMDSFRLFLRRNKLITESHKRNYLNLIRFVKQLSRIRPGETKKLKQIKDKIEATEQIADVNWLMEQVEKLS